MVGEAAQADMWRRGHKEVGQSPDVASLLSLLLLGGSPTSEGSLSNSCDMPTIDEARR